jgi:hypothetical protein
LRAKEFGKGNAGGCSFLGENYPFHYSGTGAIAFKIRNSLTNFSEIESEPVQSLLKINSG